MFNEELLSILGLVIILVMASLFSFLETATVAIPEHRLRVLKDKFLWANYAYKLKLELEKVLIFSLFGNSLFNAAFTTISTILAAHVLTSLPSGIVLPATTLLIAFVIIVFSEALPKIIAAKSPAATLSLVVIPLYYLFIICRPIIWLIDQIVSSVTRLFKFRSHEGASLEEVKAMIADENSPFKEKHRSMLLNSLELENVSIKEVLIPLRMVGAIDISSDMDVIWHQITTSHHTRIIVYDGNIDNIIGFLHVKDVLSLGKVALEKQDLQSVIREIYMVHDFFPIIRQIHRAQKYRSRIFVVINEYGDILGIACLEDMLEMICGDFTTESPQQKYLAVRNVHNELIVDGAMLIRELNEMHNLGIIQSHDALTINGLILKTLNEIPNIGVCFKLDNLVFEVISIGQYWVERVKIIALDVPGKRQKVI